MSYLSRLKKLWDWESDVLRCDNCSYFKRQHTYLKNSLPMIDRARCLLGGFGTNANAACDKWQEKLTNSKNK